jgi:magnesium transporter
MKLAVGSPRGAAFATPAKTDAPRPRAKPAPEDTALHHLSRQVPRAHPGEAAGVLRERLRRHSPSTWDVVCLVDRNDRLLGTIGPQALLALADDAPVESAAAVEVPHVLPDTDQERVASIALHHHLSAVPVVERGGRLVGVVGSLSLLRILREEHVEDVHRFAGILRETRQAREAMEQPPLRRARHRLPWLLVGLLGSAVATWVMSRFEGALAGRPAIAFFVPALVYLADAIGTQSEAVAVRGLSISHARLGRLLGGELRTGLLIGAALALTAFPFTWLFVGDVRLAACVALALAASSTVATTVGMLFPWVLSKVGRDPAYGSGPLATIIQDVLTLLIYFAAVTLVLA